MSFSFSFLMSSACDNTGLVRDFVRSVGHGICTRAVSGLIFNIAPHLQSQNSLQDTPPGFSPGESIYTCHFRGQVTASNDNQPIPGARGEERV